VEKLAERARPEAKLGHLDPYHDDADVAGASRTGGLRQHGAAPATPAGMYLLRCSLCADHSDDEVGDILGMFAPAGRAIGVLPA